MYILSREQVVRTDLQTAWDFICKPQNLNRITPEELEFTIISNIPEEMYNGMLIEYRVKIPMIGTQLWLTEIKHIREKKSFVDEQRLGPYKLWYHYHEIQEVETGVKMIDQVTYEVPVPGVGNMIHALFIKKTLQRIFDYREKKFTELLEKI